MYVLDRDLGRILVFDKDGVYQSQYQWEGMKDISDFVVSEEEKKIFLLSKNNIYALELK